ncbi:MAG TPA: ABC transporter permease [Ruminococcaceae bacterium]|nr:ABC transporter permease [Oscillospiraceae bacterium]
MLSEDFMKAILVIIPVISFVYAALGGRMGEVSESIFAKSAEAVELVISICGVMCFWCGLMKVAEKAGLLEKLSRLLSVPIKLLFGGVKRGGKAVGLIAMNIAANILGLGNASTPLGIAAMKAIAEEEGAGESACDDMIMLAVLNTASLQIIPATAAALRSANGAEKPMDILPCVWIVTAYSVFIAVFSAKMLARLTRKR